jgi:hypothetical protein
VENHFPQDHPFCFCMADRQTRCFQKMKTSCWKLLEDSEAAPSQTPPGGQPNWYANLICEALRSGLWIDSSRWLCLDASSTIYRHALSLSGNLLAKIRTSRKKLHKNVHAQPWVSGALRCGLPLWFKCSPREAKWITYRVLGCHSIQGKVCF